MTALSEKSDRRLLEKEQQLFLDEDACFKAFDKDGDGLLNRSEFESLCRALFQDGEGNPYAVEATMLDQIVTIFDTNKDDVIDKEEFHFCCKKWIKPVVRPRTALVVVDVQNDFISGSFASGNYSPADQSGKEVITAINHLLEEVTFDMVAYSLDWHPENHVSFIDNVNKRSFHKTCKMKGDDAKVYDTVIFDIKNDGIPMEQKLWPKHCLQNTWGAELHKDLTVTKDAVFIHKGTNPDIDSYSAFWDNTKTFQTNLSEELKKKNITDVFVCGIATDYCVGSTTVHSLEEGYRTILIADSSREFHEADANAAKERAIALNGLVAESSKVKGLASGVDRPPILAYKLALELAKTINKE